MFLSSKGLARTWDLMQVPPFPYFDYPFPPPLFLPLLSPSSAFLNASFLPRVKRLSLVSFVVSPPLQKGIWLL